MSIARIAALGAIVMVCCGQQTPPPAAHVHSLGASMSPGIAARENFEWAVADYKKCLATKSANECEGERHIMDAAAVAAGNSLR
jgi:hypothetical protein